MIVSPFFLLLFAILEVGLIFTIDSVLETAVDNAGRLVRTGRAEVQAFDETRFKEEVCGRMSVFAGACGARAAIDVRVVPQFSTDLPDPVEGGVFDTTELKYQGGAPGDLIVVRAWYRHPVLNPFLVDGLLNLGFGDRLLTATTAFKNEPWPATAPGTP